MNPVIPLMSIGLFAVCIHVFSGYVLEWIERNPLKLAAFLFAVAALFVFIRFAPVALTVLRVLACGCGQ
jgi:hypothetical protein